MPFYVLLVLAFLLGMLFTLCYVFLVTRKR